ncbi:MAG: hypothetical protein NC430_03585 [bacterium]|nr:hypothetical protein [bacterium]
MMRMSSASKYVTVIIVIFIFLTFIRSGGFTVFESISEYLQQDAVDEQTVSVETIEQNYVSTLANKQLFIDFNGFMAKTIGMQGYYSDIGIYITDDDYIVSRRDKTSTDYEYEQIVSFKTFLETKGINLLYVNEPEKYINDAFFTDQFGIMTYANQNADLFLKRISEAGIDYIDLRENIVDDDMNSLDMFYRTDHHWTVPSGLWASGKISEGLNRYCGYSIDLSIFDPANYTFKKYEKCWLGEQGRKVGASYVGVDDYTVVTPNFSTDFSFKTQEGLMDGTFDYFINESVYDPDQNEDIYKANSWHYSYAQRNVINNKVAYGKILILGDSYDQVTEPFIALGVSEVDSLILRNYDDSFNLRDYIIGNGYDTVIICYAQFMIGAHDNTSSANYRMFCFE